MKFSLTLRIPEEFSAHVSIDHVILGIYYGIMIVIIILTATQVYRKGYRPARFFLYGWSFLLLSVFIQIMANLGTFNLTAEHMGQLGSAIEVILLSFALADRMKIQKSESFALNTRAVNDKSQNLGDNAKISNPKEFVRRPIFTILQMDYNLTY